MYARPLRYTGTEPIFPFSTLFRSSVKCLRAINTGDPGSFTTIHANSLRGALDQLALMVMQTGFGLSRSDTIAYAASVIDVIVQLGRDDNGRRGIDRKRTRLDCSH